MKKLILVLSMLSGACGHNKNLLIDAVAWRQTAAEYRALYHQGFNIARLRVDMALARHKPGDKPLAIITDIDETILSSDAYWGYLISQGLDFFDDTIWDQWIAANQLVATPGALEFLNYVHAKGVEIFFVSSRDQGDKTDEYALANLHTAGIKFADIEHTTILRQSSNKEIRQRELAEKYDIVVMLGDNLNDFQRLYYVREVSERIKLMEADRDSFGDKFIIMPNPTDGHWLRAIFGDSEPKPTSENRELFKKAAMRTVWKP